MTARAALDLPEILDALVVDLLRPGIDGWIALFVVLGDGAELQAVSRSSLTNPATLAYFVGLAPTLQLSSSAEL